MKKEVSIFTKIINREVPSEIIFETENSIVIKDISPQTPIHFLIISKKPFEGIKEMTEEDFVFAKDVFKISQHLSTFIKGAAEFKLVMNNGYKAGQRVFHAHVHFMAGF
jgi:histidine triad (HIT) family protein